MAKKFRGFNDKQTELIANKLGYTGPMEGFSEWVVKDKNTATRFSRLTEKARSLVEGPQHLAEGGSVKKPPGNIKTKYDNLPGDNDPYPYWYGEEGSGVYIGKDPKKLAESGPKDDQGNPIPVDQFVKSIQKPGDPSKPGDEAIKPGEMSPTTQTFTVNNKGITPANTSKVDNNKNQYMKPKSGDAGKVDKVVAAPKTNAAQVANAAQAKTPQATKANLVGTKTVTGDVKKELNGLEAEQGTLSKGSKVVAATARPSKNATVQGQLEKLMASFEGEDPPAWAAGAMRMAQTVMAQRGLGSSSMAGGAITQAAMESAIGIAAQDAATFSQFEMQNLNNRQQARLQNAQAFLQMDLANLNNRQQTALFKSQAVIQSLFTDQAATNATAQFNATSKNQTDQFFANLKTQVSTFNAAQSNAIKVANMEQKNQVSMNNQAQSNAIRQFNAELESQREQFNAQNRLIVDQANAKWRQQIATLDNAQTNENNRLNAQLATGLTTAAYNNLWQNERDLMSYAWTSAENAAERANQIVLAKMQSDTYKAGYKAESQAALGQAAGSLISSLIDGIDW